MGYKDTKGVDIVKKFNAQVIKNLNFSERTFELIDGKLGSLVDKVRCFTTDQLSDLNSYISNVSSKFKVSELHSFENWCFLSQAIERLELSVAREIIANIESQPLGIDNASSQNKLAKQKVKDVLLEIGYTPSENDSLEDLNEIWQEELRLQTSKRSHLLQIQKNIADHENISLLPEKVRARANEFKLNIEKPDLWINKSYQQDFQYFSESPMAAIRIWLENYEAYTKEIQKQVSNLIVWYFNFIESRSRAVNALKHGEVDDEVLDPLIDVSDIIETGKIPSACFEAIKEDFPYHFESNDSYPELDLELSSQKKDPMPVQGETSKDTSNKSLPNENNDTQKIVNFKEIPADLSALIEAENWPKATAYCMEKKIDKFEKCFQFIDNIFSEKFFPSDDIIVTCDNATLIFGPVNLSGIMAEKVLSILVFNLLTEIYVKPDENSNLSLKKPDNLSWQKLFTTEKLFLGLDGSITIPENYKKILSLIFRSYFAINYSSNIWLAAKDLSRNYEYQGNFLKILYSLHCDELIIEMAGKFEPKIKAELKDLFKARLALAERPEISTIVQSLTKRVLDNARSNSPFAQLLESLSVITKQIEPEFDLIIDEELTIIKNKGEIEPLKIPITVSISNLILETVEVNLSKEDDVFFTEYGRAPSRRATITTDHIYTSQEFWKTIELGTSWDFSNKKSKNSFRVGLKGKGLVDDKIYTSDKYCTVKIKDRAVASQRSIPDDTIFDFYPGLSNTVLRSNFWGRIDELEKLNSLLISRQTPSPVLLTGMRRVGKSSLLQKFHARHSSPDNGGAVTIYLSLAEKKAHLANENHSVSKIIWDAIKRPFTKNIVSRDNNYHLANKLKDTADSTGQEIKHLIKSCYDEESLADTIIEYSEVILNLLGEKYTRVVLLIDEAEALVEAFKAGKNKEIELEQMFHSLREVNQLSPSTGLLLSGSHHINIFAEDYKSAFFGSCARLNLEGIVEFDQAKHLIAPTQVKPYVEFEKSAIEYAIEICAGMPLWMWYVGALTCHKVKSGKVTISDVKRAVKRLVSGDDLFFTPVDALTPLEFEIGLEPNKESDFLWILLHKIAFASSTTDRSASKHTIVDRHLCTVDTEEAWLSRLSRLTELKLIKLTGREHYSFAIPIFAEAFRAPHRIEDYLVKEQKIS